MLPEPHNKKLQIDRIIFFSDAVFAIAITLLVIEVKVPELHGEHMSEHALLRAVLNLTPKFVGVLVSFFVIGVYWVTHHKLFGYLTDYSPRLIWLNLFFLLSIIFMPFSSALYSDYWMGPFITHQAFYVGNILWTGWLNFRLWSVIADGKNHLSHGLENKAFVNYYKTRSLTSPAVFLLSLLVAFINPFVAYFVAPLVMPLAFMAVNWYYKKKHPELQEKH